jgi:rod shape-determining protein MreC
MVASRSSNSNPARIPALVARVVLLVIASILLMVLDHRQNHLDAVRRTLGTAVYPIQIVVDAPFRLWAWMREAATNRNELQLQVSRLQAERLLTNARLQRLSALESENARLRDLLEARTHVRDEVRVAEIMAVEANPYSHSIVINVGKREGAYDGQAIVDAAGSLPVEINRNGLRTIANGTGEFGRLVLPFITNNADIRPGDLLVTSGLGGAFPAGYPVAVIDTVNRIPQEPFADVSATPSAKLDQVREVMLIWSSKETADE